MFSKSPLHLKFMSSGYAFRYSLPKDVRSKFGRTEVKIALRIYSFSEARTYSRLISSLIQKTIERLRKGQPVNVLTNKQIIEIVNEYFKTLCAADESKRIWPGWDENDIECVERIYEESRDDLSTCFYEPILEMMKLWIPYQLKKNAPQESEITLKDFSIRRLCRDILKARVKYAEISRKRTEGDYSGEFSYLDEIVKSVENAHYEEAPVVDDEQTSPKIAVDTGRTLAEVIETFSDECRRADKWKPRTETEMKTTFELLKRVLGDVPIKRITRQNIADFKDTLLKLPPNINKKKEYKNKSIPEIIEYARIHKPSLLSMVTVSKIMGRVTTLFGYAYTHGYIPSDPANGITVPVGKKQKTIIAPYTDQDLFQMFGGEVVGKDQFRHPYQLWALILAPFTGCRLNEICQLHLEDIRLENGIWVLDINDNTSDKNIKYEASRRLIPLHPFLIDELHLPALVENLKQKGAKRLFPELKFHKK